MKDTGIADRENKPIYVGDVVEIYSMDCKVGIGEVEEYEDTFIVEWFGEYTDGLANVLEYLSRVGGVKVIERPLYLK